MITKLRVLPKLNAGFQPPSPLKPEHDDGTLVESGVCATWPEIGMQRAYYASVREENCA